MSRLIRVFVLIAFSGSILSVHARQTQVALSDQRVMKQDTNAVNALIERAYLYFFNKPDSTLHYSIQAADLARKLNYTDREIEALQITGEAKRFVGDYPGALEYQFRAMELAKKVNLKIREAYSLGFIGFTYTELREYRRALPYLFAAKSLYEQYYGPSRQDINLSSLAGAREAFNLSNIGGTYEGLGLLDSALLFLNQAWTQAEAMDAKNLMVLTLRRLGNVSVKKGDYDEALRIYHDALRRARLANDRVNPSHVQLLIASLYDKLNQKDSCLYYARRALVEARTASQRQQIMDAASLIGRMLRDKPMPDSVIYYQDLELALRESLFGAEKFRQLQVLALREQQRQQEIVREQEEFRNQSRLLALSGILVFVLVIAFILYRNYRQKHKTNLLLEEQKSKLEQALHELNAAQALLVQSEKMASLGELTAGIAHEIQNPLNFVNNFSEVNAELITELEQEIEKGNIQEANRIARSIKENEEKIVHHGKRADGIVKSMLQHSRSSTGKKELTDINALCDEYLRLAFHGYRAKDKSFNAKFETDFDSAVPKINVVPQDIGRVVLNLINNAFYVVNEKRRASSEDYEPTVTVSTRRAGNSVLISVKDNGPGIPDSIKDKIFQPFFTTKPTGQGTGLGLSLAYDIVTIGHGGEIEVQSEENFGSTFILSLTINSQYL